MSAFDISTLAAKTKPFNSQDGGMKILKGTVVDNVDPDKMERIKVSIPDLLEGDKDGLPWLYALHPAGLGQSDKLSHFCVPEIGTGVFCIFPEGSMYFGYYVWHTRDKQSIPEVFKTNYPERYGWMDSNENSHVVDKKDKTITNTFADKGVAKYDSKNKKSEYTDPFGSLVQIDRGSQKLHAEFSGVTFDIEGGNLTINAPGTITIKSGSSMTLQGSSFGGKFGSVKWSQ